MRKGKTSLLCMADGNFDISPGLSGARRARSDLNSFRFLKLNPKHVASVSR